MAATTATQRPSSASSEKKKDDETQQKASLQDQLDKAQAHVEQCRDATLKLHIWWRQYLFGLNILVFLLCFRQAQIPSAACIKNIKVRERRSEKCER